MPPRIAPHQIIILPVIKDDNEAKVEAFCLKLRDDLKAQGFRVKYDNRDMRTPDKMWDAVKRGVPLRVEIGEREVDAGQLTHVRRDIGRDSKTTVSVEQFGQDVQGILDDIHDNMLARVRKFRDENIVDVSTVSEIKEFYAADNIGFVKAPVEILEDSNLDAVMTEFGLSTRNMPFDDNGKKVLIAKAY